MELNYSNLTEKELLTIGAFLRNDLQHNPENPDDRREILKQILLELEDRGVIDRLEAAIAHKSLQTGDYRTLTFFKPTMYVVSKKKINDFLKEKMHNFDLVISWTKHYIRNSRRIMG